VFILLSDTALVPDIYSCQEAWFDADIRDPSNTNQKAKRVQTCRKGDRPVSPSTHYFIKSGNAYRVHVDIERSDPSCFYGGGPGNMGQIAEPICWLPRDWHRMRTDEHRYFWFVSRDGANFHPVSIPHAVLSPTQQSQLSHYAVDSDSVYRYSGKIEGADPKTFEVIFPFAEILHLQKYSIARDNQHLYVDGWPFPLIDLSQVKWLQLPCSNGEYSKCDREEYRQPSLGTIGDDLIYFEPSMHAALFKGVAKSDLSCSLYDSFKASCISGGHNYQFSHGISERDVRLEPEG